MVYGGVATKYSPYRVKMEGVNPSMVTAYGPGLEKGVKSNVPTHFTVNCRDGGPGELRVSIKDSEEKEIPFSVTDNKDGTYTVTYVAREPGACVVNLNYGGVNIPQCPIKVNVQSSVDVSKVKVDDLARSKYKIICFSLQSLRLDYLNRLELGDNGGKFNLATDKVTSMSYCSIHNNNNNYRE